MTSIPPLVAARQPQLLDCIFSPGQSNASRVHVPKCRLGHDQWHGAASQTEEIEMENKMQDLLLPGQRLENTLSVEC